MSAQRDAAGQPDLLNCAAALSSPSFSALNVSNAVLRCYCRDGMSIRSSVLTIRLVNVFHFHDIGDLSLM